MKKVTIFWKGMSKNAHMYIGVTYSVKGFACKKFVQILDEDVFASLPESGELEIPEQALM